MLSAPRMFITFESKLLKYHSIMRVFCFMYMYASRNVLNGMFLEPHQYQLRAYVYQARDLIPSDSSGVSGKRLLTDGKLTVEFQ